MEVVKKSSVKNDIYNAKNKMCVCKIFLIRPGFSERDLPKGVNKILVY